MAGKLRRVKEQREKWRAGGGLLDGYRYGKKERERERVENGQRKCLVVGIICSYVCMYV